LARSTPTAPVDGYFHGPDNHMLEILTERYNSIPETAQSQR